MRRRAAHAGRRRLRWHHDGPAHHSAHCPWTAGPWRRWPNTARTRCARWTSTAAPASSVGTAPACSPCFRVSRPGWCTHEGVWGAHVYTTQVSGAAGSGKMLSLRDWLSAPGRPHPHSLFPRVKTWVVHTLEGLLQGAAKILSLETGFQRRRPQSAPALAHPSREDLGVHTWWQSPFAVAHLLRQDLGCANLDMASCWQR